MVPKRLVSKILPDVLPAHGIECAGKTKPGIADDGVNAAKFLNGGGNDLMAIFGARDIDPPAAMVRADFPLQRLEPIKPPCSQDQPAPIGGQIHRQGPPDARAGARYHRDHVVQASTHRKHIVPPNADHWHCRIYQNV